MPYIEWFGTASSVVVAISLMQKNIKWLRLLNFFGAAGFGVYGFLIQSWPVTGLNTFIALIDIWYLLQEKFRKDQFDYIEIDTEKSRYLIRFLEFHAEELRRFIPEAQIPPPPGTRTFLILRNALPVSLVIFRELENNEFEILIDYAVPQYRDRQNARFFFNYVARHLKPGEHIRFISSAGSPLHQKYLKSMWFKPAPDGRYIREG